MKIIKPDTSNQCQFIKGGSNVFGSPSLKDRNKDKYISSLVRKQSPEVQSQRLYSNFIIVVIDNTDQHINHRA